MIEKLISDQLPPPIAPFSHLATSGGLAWSAGFGPHEPKTGAVPEGITAQTEATLDNVATALTALGLDWSDVIKMTVHLQDLHRDFDAFNEVYGRRLTPPYPVRTTVGSDLLGILVEIDVIAATRPARVPH